MKERTLQSLDLSILPLNETAIVVDGKFLVLDNLDTSWTSSIDDEMLLFRNRFPMKLALSCMLIVVKGTVKFSINFHDYVVTSGTCVVIMSGTIVEQIATDEQAKVILLSFSQNDFRSKASYYKHNFHRLYALQVLQVTLHPQHLDLLMNTYRMLRTILTDPAFEFKREDTASRCIDLMGSIIEQGASEQFDYTTKTSRKDEIVSRFLQCVTDNYRQHRELGFYADQLCLSLKYMSHVIYEQTGRHPSQWIKDYVILDAKTMLRSGHYSVQQVADELNFPNQSFFGKYFKEAVGVSPKKWK